MSNYELYDLILHGTEIILTIITLLIALWGINSWKKEHVGKRRLELLEKLYPNLKTIKKNLPFILRTETTEYEVTEIKKGALKKGTNFLNLKEHYQVIELIDHRLQNIFFEQFRILQAHTYFADIFLDAALGKIYHEIANLNLHFPIEFHSKSVNEIKTYQNQLEERVKPLTDYFINEIKKAA